MTPRHGGTEGHGSLERPGLTNGDPRVVRGIPERAMIGTGAAGQRTRKEALPGGTERQLAALRGPPVDRHWRRDHASCADTSPYHARPGPDERETHHVSRRSSRVRQNACAPAHLESP